MKNAKKHLGKRILAIMLAIIFVFSVAPINSIVIAADENDIESEASVFTVIVTDGENNPVSGAEVKLENEAALIDETVETDSDGKAEFASIAALEATFDGNPSEFVCDYTITADGYDLAVGDFCPADEGGWSGEITIKIVKTKLPITNADYEIDAYNGVYDKAAHKAVSVTADGFDVMYKLGAGDFSSDVPEIKNAGEYAVVVKLMKDGYITKEVPVTAKIEKADRTFGFETASPENLVYKFILTYNNKAKTDDEPGAVVYSIKDIDGKNVAEIDEATGKVTFKKIGTVEVTATMAGSDNYNQSIATYKITVDPTDRDFGFADTSPSDIVYEENLTFTNIVENKESVGTVKYEILSQKRDGADVDDVATIDKSSGTVTINASGTIVVKASVEAAGNFKKASDTYTLTIKRAKQNLTFEKANISGLAYNDEVTNALTGGLSTGKITYEVVNQISSTEKPDVVTVGENGKVTAVGIGSAVIKATKAADFRYEADDATFNVTTVKADQKNFKLGENKTVYYGTKDATYLAEGNETTKNVTYSLVFPVDVTPFAEVDAESGKITFKDKKTGSFTLKAETPGDDFYNKAEATCIIKIEEKDFSVNQSVDAVVGENGWFTSDYRIIVSEGFKIGYSNSMDDNTEWLDKIVISKEGKTDSFGYYLKEIKTGYISKVLINPDVNIDKVDPTIDISYSTPVASFLAKLFFKDEVKVTLSSVDATSGVKQFSYSLNGGEVVTVDNVSFDANNGVYYYEFNIPAQFNGKVTANALDFSGRKAKSELFNPDADTELVVDNIAPNVTITFDNNEGYDGIYSAARTATIRVTEKNFYPDDLKVSLRKRLNNEASYSDVDLDLEFTAVDGEKDTYEATFTCGENGDYIIDAEYTDKSGNTFEYQDDIRFTIDTIKTQLAISYDDGDTKHFYNTNRRLKVEVNERNFKPHRLTLEVTGKSTDKNGNEQAVELADYEKMLRETEWKTENGVHVGYIEFTEEARYSIELSYNDYSLWDTDVIKDEFVIDKQKPSDLKIEYGEPLNIFEQIFFGKEIEVTLSAFDSVADLDKFVYSYEVSEGVSSENQGKKNVTVKSNEFVNGSYTFKIPAQFRGLVSFTAYDKSENASDIKYGDMVVVADNIAPGVNVSYVNNVFENGKYYNADRNAVIEIDEANFFESDVKVYVNGQEETLTFNSKLGESNDVIEDIYVAERLFGVDGDYELKIDYKDRSNNSASYESGEFVIDKTAPVISINYNNNDVLNDKYFDANRTATITVNEHNFNPMDFDFEIKGEVTGKDGNVDNVINQNTYIDFIHNIDNWDKNGDVYTIELPEFNIDARYTIKASYKDLAGNESNTLDEYFVIDKKEAVDFVITYEEPTLIEKILFFRDEAKVTISAFDAVSGVKSFDYKYELAENVSDVNVGGSGTKAFEEGVCSAAYTFSIPAQYRGYISAVSKDYAENQSTVNDEKVVVVDKIAPNMDVVFENNNVLNGKYYKGDRTATVIVNEANFFAEDVELIVYRQLDNETEFRKLSDTYTFAPVDGEKDTYSAVIPFNENADYKFDIKYTDRSGNVFDSYDEVEFVIDKIAPVVALSYKEKAEPLNTNNYNKNRTPVITVTEHNFDPTNFELDIIGVITGKDGTDKTVFTEADGYLAYVQDINNWKSKGSDVYEIELPQLTIDARYKINRIAYTDLAGNASDVLDDEFVIDKNKPSELEIIYEDTTWYKSLLEGVTFGFYKSKATVTLKAADFVSGLDYFTYSYKVGNGATPVNQGKENVVVTPDADGTYTMNIPAQFRGQVTFTATNKAGNTSDKKYDTNVVVVDDIAPEVSVVFDNNSASNGKYYKADRTATITVEEANFWAEDIVVTVGKRYNDETEYTFSNKTLEFTPVEGKPGVYTTLIKFNKNADYTLDINYKDKSGNAAVYTSNTGTDKETFEKLEFTVDKISPKLSVSFDNNKYKNENCYKANRTATVTVVEHNFNPKDMICAILGETVVGNGVDLTSKDYSKYIKNIDNWTSVGDTHTIELDFDIDAQYDVVISYSDLADNVVKKNITEDFVVDKVAPSDLQIKYEEKSVLDVILESITFGFYKAPVTVVLTAVDEISGVDFITYSYTVDGNASKVNEGKTNVVVPAKDLVREVYPETVSDGEAQYEKVTTKFTIPAQFRGYVSFYATDKAGNVSDIKLDDKMIVIDDIAPVIGVKYDKYTDNNHYKKRISTITVTEANFWADDVNITIKRRLDTEKKYSVIDYVPEFKPVDGVADTYEAIINYNDINANAEYIFDIDYTDKSGNKAVYLNDANETVEDYTQDKFVVDVTIPTINGTYNNNDVRNGDKFKADRTLTIVITEHNFRSEDVKAVVTAKDSAGKNVKIDDYTDYLKKAESWSSDGDVHTAKIKFGKEANYTFDISYTDPAGNHNSEVNYGDSEAPAKFTIDKTVPTASIKVGKWDASTDGTKWDKFLDNVTFSLWGNKAVEVKASSADELSGVDIIEHFKSDEVLTLAQVKAYENWTVENGTKFSYTVEPDERFIVYVHVVDKSGNEIYISSDGIIVDKTLPDIETIAPEIAVAPHKQPINGIYNENVSVDIKVIDPVVSTVYSGLKSVTYEIYNNAESVTEPTQKGTLFTYDITAKKQADLVQVYDEERCITVNAKKNNSNDVTIKIVAVDNSDNVTVRTCDIKIDITAPVIDISYSNNNVDSKSYFNANRTAEIIITERNFVAEDVVVEITNTDGKAPELSSWKKVKGTGNLDDTKWIATVKYAKDGDYTFKIGYIDEAGLECKEPNYANGTVAPEKFTIDKIAPKVKVTYDNNKAVNGNYFVAERVATVVVKEHNFNAGRVDIDIKSTDDGKGIAEPRRSSWVNDGDVHTCKIYYKADAKYIFDIDVKDKANNKSADYKADTFFVDKTDPEIQITNIENHSANSGKVAPVIRFSDTNFDRNNVKVVVNGANRGSVAPNGAYSDIHNGVIFSFNNFAEEKEIDDIYTVNVSITDKAGRTKTENVTFSVNRFGSTYALGKDLKKLVDKFYSNKSNDIVLTETNPNQLSNIKLTLFKNTETKITLKEGSDYKIDVQGGNGNWYKYVYTIFEKNFTADGLYSLTIHSEDSAGNVAENTLDTKNMNIDFVVDKTNPRIKVTNVEDGMPYVAEAYTLKMSADDNLGIKKVVLELNGVEACTWKGKELKSIVDANEDLTYDIPQSEDAYSLKVIAIDEAGNETVVEVKDFYVSTNRFVKLYSGLLQFYDNKPLFFGTIVGVAVLGGAIIFIIARKKKKDEEK